MDMYVPTGCYYTDVTTDYIKIIPGLLTFSKSNSVKIENDHNDHKVHRVVAKHYTMHFLYFFSFTVTFNVHGQTNTTKQN